jgi:hypothetical protein
MKIRHIINESWPGRSRNRTRIYTLLLNHIDSGPFDGGCIVFAQALQIRYGGSIEVLLRANTGQADHAVVRQDDIMIDADGAANIDSFIRRFERNELVQISGYRPIEPGDLPGAARNLDLSKQIAKLL